MIAQVLVIDRIEEQLLYNVHEIRNLEHEHPVWSQHLANPISHVGQTVRMGENVIRSNHSRLPASRFDLLRQLKTEKGRQRFYPRPGSLLRNLHRRIYSQNAKPLCLKKFQ